MADVDTPLTEKNLSNITHDKIKKINLGIRSKILLYFGGVILLLILIIYMVMSTLVYSGFEQIESYYGQKNVMRVAEAIYSDSLSLQGVCEDYSVWDATYDFVKGEYPEYTDSDLTDETLFRFHINYLIITDLDNNFVLFKHLDGQTVSSIPTSEETDAFKREKRFFVHQYTNDSINGILLLPSGPVLFAATNILKTDGSGNSAGSMIMIRNIDKKYLDKISSQTKLNASIIPYDVFNENPLSDPIILTGTVTGKFIAASELNSDIEKYPFKIIDDKNSLSYTVINDLDGTPSFVLRVLSDREIYSQAKTMMSLFLISSIVIFLLSYLLLYFVINKTLLSRITNINEDIHRLTEKNDYKERITVIGNDELSDLGISFNNTLDGLEAANQERNILFDANPDTLLMVDTTGKIVTKKISESLLKKSSKEINIKDSDIEVSKIFSEDNIVRIRIAALESINEGASKLIEFKERLDNLVNYYEARILLYKKNALVIVRDITDKKIEENFLKSKNEESESFNKIAINRELKMIELKKEIEELKNKLVN